MSVRGAAVGAIAALAGVATGAAVVLLAAARLTGGYVEVGTAADTDLSEQAGAEMSVVGFAPAQVQA